MTRRIIGQRIILKDAELERRDFVEELFPNGIEIQMKCCGVTYKMTKDDIPLNDMRCSCGEGYAIKWEIDSDIDEFDDELPPKIELSEVPEIKIEEKKKKKEYTEILQEFMESMQGVDWMENENLRKEVLEMQKKMMEDGTFPEMQVQQLSSHYPFLQIRKINVENLPDDEWVDLGKGRLYQDFNIDNKYIIFIREKDEGEEK